MRSLRLLVPSLVALFGLIASGFGATAEVKRVKASQVLVLDNRCYYPSSPSLPLGLLAAIALLIAQVISNASGGCICCCTNQPSNISSNRKTIAILSLALSWVTFTNAFFLLVEGAALNGQQQYQGWVNNCYIVKPGVFAAGAALAIATTMLAILYYLMATSASADDDLKAAIGQPAIAASQVVFVPEYSHPFYMDKSANNPYIGVAKAV